MKDISRHKISAKVNATHPDYHILPLEARTQFHGTLPAKVSIGFDAPTRPWMRLACGKYLRVTVELPHSFCGQIHTVVKTTIHNFAFLSMTLNNRTSITSGTATRSSASQFSLVISMWSGMMSLTGYEVQVANKGTKQ
jgi:hypothetical protein